MNQPLQIYQAPYRALLITEAHDCNHDFFQPEDTFSRAINQKGGAQAMDLEPSQGQVQIPESGPQSMEVEPSLGPVPIPNDAKSWSTIHGTVRYNTTAGDVWEEDVVALTLSDEEIDRLSDLEIDQLSKVVYTDGNDEDKINTLMKDVPFSMKERILRDIDGTYDIYDFIHESLMLEEYGKHRSVPSAPSAPSAPKRARDEVDDVDVLQNISNKKQAVAPLEEQGGGARRVRSADVKKKQKLEEERSSFLAIIKKIQVWDMTLIKIKYGDQLKAIYPSITDVDWCEDPDDIQEIKDINASLQGKAPDACLYTLWEWTEANVPEGKFSKQVRLSGTLDIRAEDPHIQSILFGKQLEAMITGATQIESFKDVGSALTKFAKYTSVPDILKVDGQNKSGVVKFKIDLSMFIKKKWRSLKDVVEDFDTKFQSFHNKFFKKTKPLLNSAEKKLVKRLRQYIMKYWIKFAYSRVDGSRIATFDKEMSEYKWVKEWINLVEGDKDITDVKLRDSFIKHEFDMKKSDRGIFLNNTHARVVEPDKMKKLQEMSEDAWSHDAVGNNVAIDSHYIKGYKKFPSGIKGHLFSAKKKYNCNHVNVADPGSTCPKWGCNGKCEEFNITLKEETTGKVLMTSNIVPGAKGDLSLGSINYEIQSLDGAAPLKVTNFPLGVKGVSGSQGLTKTNILNQVFVTMKTLIKSATPGNNRDILSSFLDIIPGPGGEQHIREVIQKFALKLFGDFSQELFSVQQSFSKANSVFVGNDWVSSIRYLFLQKVVNQGATRRGKWWGGFMGGSDCFLMTNIAEGSGKSKKSRKRKRKSIQKKSKSRSKSRSKSIRKKSKRRLKSQKRSKRRMKRRSKKRRTKRS